MSTDHDTSRTVQRDGSYSRETTPRRSKPTRTSTAIAVGGTLAVLVALLQHVDDILGPVALGGGGAVLFGLSCWLLSRDDTETAARPLVSIFTLPVALGLFGSSGVATLLLASSLFPVPEGPLFSTTALVIAGHVGVVFGSTIAVLGLTLGRKNVVTATTLKRYSSTTFLTALVPGGIGTGLIAEALLFENQGPLSLFGTFLVLTWEWLTAGGSVELPLAGFLFVLAFAITSVLAAVIVLPVQELLYGGGRRHRTELDVGRLKRWLVLAAGVAISLHLLALGLEITRSERELAALFGSTLHGLVYGLATTRLLRFLILAGAVVAVTAALLGAVARRVARHSLKHKARTGGPFVGGIVVTAVAVVVAEPVYDRILSLILDSVPTGTAADIERMSTALMDLYGVETFAILLGFALVTGTLCFVLVIRLALFFRYLSTDSPGYSLASGGLCFAIIAASTLGVPTWLVFGGILTSLLVWDMGRFGTTLGQEIGSTAATQTTELVHAGGTLFVGVLGALAGTALLTQVDALWTIPSGETSVALLALAVGLISFAIALR